MRSSLPDPGVPAAIRGALDALGEETHVWVTRTSAVLDPRLLERYGAILSREELAREERFRTSELRQLFRVSHALVRTSLSRYAPVAPQDWEFCEGEHGRPEIVPMPGQPRLRFNLSHTQGLAVCVVTREVDCGVDVERVARMGQVKNLEALARRVFSASELAEFMSRSDDRARLERFTDYWVLKEAYVKARGMGFQLPLREISFDIQNRAGVGMAFTPGFDDDASDWELTLQEHLVPEVEFRLGVAVRRAHGPSRRVVVREVIPLVPDEARIPIYFVLDSQVVGGAEMAWVELTEHLDTRRFYPQVICPPLDVFDPLVERLRRAGGECIARDQIKGTLDFVSRRRFRKLIASLPPGILHFNLGAVDACRYQIAVARGGPHAILATVHACSPASSARKNRWHSKSLRALDHAFCISQAVAAGVEELAPETPVSIAPPILTELLTAEVERIYMRFAKGAGLAP